MACLYTICVTVFLRSTTYWSKDSICPWSLIPVDEIDGYRHVLLAQGIQERIL